MLTYEQIADDIRTVLMAEIDPTREAMQELDARFAQAINEVNVRLRECGSLLNKGLRTEAIHSSEAEPTLLEVVAIIDIPEFDIWSSFAKQFDCSGPPRLLTEIAEQLNDAYNEEASLGDLLRKHRLHALTRSPLVTRLSVLRKLAHRDSGTPIWQDDVLAYEKVRQNQLRGEIESAYAGENLKALALLEQEVRSQEWMQAPSDDVIDKATKSHTAVRVKTARNQLQALVDKLTDAHAEFDVERGRTLRSRWHAQVAIALDRDDDPLVELVAPALDWLTEQDQTEQEEADYAATLGAIDQALDDWSPRQELERLYYQLQSFDRELSSQLESRLTERFDALEVTARRRSRLILMGSVASIMVVAGLVSWGIFAYSRADVLAKHVASLAQLVEAKSITEAETYLVNLKESAPEVFDSAEIQKLAGDTHQMRTAEEGREARLAQLLSSARETGANWEGYFVAKGSLDEADDVIANDGERADVAQVRREVEATRQRMQKEYNDAFAPALSQYGSRCDAVDTGDLLAIKQLSQEGASLAQRPRVSAVLIGSVKPLLERLQAQRETELRRRGESELLVAIDRAVGNWPAFQQAAENYIEALPQKSLAGSLKRVLENETKIRDGIKQWNAFIRAWEARDYRNQSAAEAAELIAEAEAIIGQHPGFPAVANVRAIVDFLTPITRRVDDNGDSRHLELNELLGDNIHDLRMLLVYRNRQYHRYYFDHLKDPRTVGDQLRVTYFEDTEFEDGEKKEAEIYKESVRNDVIRDRDDEEFDWTAPQTKFRRAALDQLVGFDKTNWEKEFYQLILALDENYAMKMAPQVRVQLLSLLLRLGCEGSAPMKEAYKNHLDLLESTPLNEEPTWVDPKDPDGRKTNIAAIGLLKRLAFRTLENPTPINPRMTPRVVTTTLVALLNAMNKPKLGDRYAWVGWIRRDESHRLTVIMRSDFEGENAELLVFYPGSNDQLQIMQIGSLVSGELELSRDAPVQAVSVGRPVYIVTP